MFEFEPFVPGSKSGRVHVGTSPNMVTTESEWLWARDIPGSDCKAGEPVYKVYKKTIFKHWIEMGWVKEAPQEAQQLTMF